MLRNLVIMLGLYVVWRFLRNSLKPRRRPGPDRDAAERDSSKYRNLTDQEISDADYEDLDGS